MVQKVNLAERLEQIHEPWRPKVVGELNGQVVQLAKLQGPFVWHHHEHEDEAFLGISGRFRIEFRDHEVEVGPGDLVVVPRGVEHRPVADGEASVLLFEPASTVNTGNITDAKYTAPRGAKLG